MAMTFHTIDEMAAILGVAAVTLNRHCKTDHGCLLKEYVAKFKGLGVMSLRRKQMQLALEGNVTMLRWMGIQYLNQSPKVVMLHKVPPTDATPQPGSNEPDPEGFQIDGLTDMENGGENHQQQATAGDPSTHVLTLEHQKHENDGSVVDAEIVPDED